MTEPLSVGLLEAIDDKRLLGASYTPFPRQREALGHVETCTRNVWCLGRRSGKSTMCGTVLAWRAALCDLRAHVMSDELIYHVVIANSKEQAAVTLNAARRHLLSSTLLQRLVMKDTADEIQLRNKSVIAAFVCSGRQTRGFAVGTLVLDEFAFFQTSEDGPAAAKTVYTAMTPSLAQFADDRRLVISSTPNGSNYFQELFDQALAEATVEATADE